MFFFAFFSVQIFQAIACKPSQFAALKGNKGKMEIHQLRRAKSHNFNTSGPCSMDCFKSLPIWGKPNSLSWEAYFPWDSAVSKWNKDFYVL